MPRGGRVRACGSYTRGVHGVCNTCGAGLAPDARFCAQCGTEVARTCHGCGSEVTPDARFCSTCGEALDGAPPPEDAQGHREERRIVSVLFVDLVGFTAHSERADPEDVNERLTAFHGAVRADVERFGGRIEKLLGDGVLAVFGAPHAHEDDPERAVRAALRLFASLEELDVGSQAIPLTARAAVTTGEALIQLEDMPDREGIVGDVVNTAARLETVADTGTVVVDERTYLAARAALEFEPRDPVELKGKSSPVAIWTAIRARGRYGVGVEEQDHDAPFVGRAEEVSLLVDAFERTVARNRPQLITLTGEAGVGKSRLVREFRRILDDRSELLWWRQGRCLPYGEGVTFWAIGEIVKAHAGILESEPPAEARAKLDQAVAAVIEDPDDAAWVALRMAPLIGTGGAESASRDELFAAWTRFFEGLAAKDPLVMVIEDLHWADDAVVAFLDHILEWVDDAPILVVASARPELYSLRPDWGGGKRDAATLSLPPLAPAETVALMSSMAERALMPAEAQQTLLERSGGNPLYVTEYVRLAKERGLLDGSSGDDLPVPDTVQAIIQARIDMLDEPERRLLEAAAVVGRVFWSGAVSFLTGMAVEEVDSTFRRLARRDLVRPVRRPSMLGQSEFTFTHVLIRDVAYSRLTRDRRGRLHESTASWLEAVSGDRAADAAELLAHHHAAALELRPTDDPERRARVYRFLMLAGERAKAFDAGRGKEFFSRAAELAGSDVDRGRAQLEMARLEFDSPEDALAAAASAAQAFAAAGDAEAEAEATELSSGIEWYRGNSAAVDAHDARALELIRGLPPTSAVAKVLSAVSTKAQLAGREEESLELADRALAIAREVGDTETYARTLITRASALAQIGDWEAIEDVREGLRIHLDRNETTFAARAYSNLATMLGVIGRVEDALAVGEEAIAYETQRGLTAHADWSKMTTIEALFPMGRWSEALKLVDELHAADAARGGSQMGMFVTMWESAIRFFRGDTRAAMELWTGAIGDVRDLGDPQGLFPSLSWGVSYAAESGDRALALALTDEMESLGREHPFFLGTSLVFAARGLVSIDAAARLERLLDIARGGDDWVDALLGACRGLLEEQDGALESAISRHRRVWELGEPLGQRFEPTRSRIDAARCLQALGRTDEASELLDEALHDVDAMGAGLLAGQVAELSGIDTAAEA